MPPLALFRRMGGALQIALCFLSLAPDFGGLAAASRAGDGLPPSFGSVIVDTDFGEWMDDPFALAFLFSELGPRLELVITTGSREAALLAAQLLTEGGDGARLPAIAQGLLPPRPSNHRNHPRPPSLAGYLNHTLLPTLEQSVLSDGILAARGVVEGGGGGVGSVLWLCIGPPTNLAAFARRYPHLTRRLTVGLMGGSFRPGIKLPWANDCCTTPIVEWNIAQDTTASRTVLSTRWASRPVFAPIDSTWNSALDGEQGFGSLLQAAFPHPKCRAAYELRMEAAGTEEFSRRWGRHGYAVDVVVAGEGEATTTVDCQRGVHAMAKALLQMYLGWLNEVLLAGPESVAFQEASYLQARQGWRHATPPLYDVFAAAQVLRFGAFDVRRTPLLIDDSGATIIAATGSDGVEVLWGWECTQPAAVWRHFLGSLLGGFAQPAVAVETE